jgi:hypothetical protein
MKNNSIHSTLINYLKDNPDIIWAFDLDDTIAQTQRKVLEKVNSLEKTSSILKEKGLYPLKYEDVKDFFFYKKIFGEEITLELFSFEGLYNENLELQDGIEDLIQFISDNFGKDKIKVVTASFDGVEEAKDDYIINKLGLEKSQIIHATDKYPHVSKSIYFDDGFHNFKSVLDCDETVKICMETPWNKTQRDNTDKIDYSIKNFNEFLDILKEIMPHVRKKHKIKKSRVKTKKSNLKV